MIVAAAHPLVRPRFRPGVAEHLGFYVYLLIDPRDAQPFYVGKGMGDRCFAHLDEARRTLADAKGDYQKLTRIREIEAAGHEVRIDILRHRLTESEAYAVESASIDLLGMGDLKNRVAGHGTQRYGRMSVDDINCAYGARPVEIENRHQVILIRVSRAYRRGMSEAELYEITRRWWRVGQRGRVAAKWAFAVYDGVVRAAYRIEGWEPAPINAVAEDPAREGRWGFWGERDAAMETRYVGRDVSDYTSHGAQNPVRYVNC